MGPLWNPDAKSASIRKWADRLHKEAKRVFLQDKAHGHLVLAFRDSGPTSITVVPPKTPQARTNAAIIMAIRKNDFYGIIEVRKARMCFQRRRKNRVACLLPYGEGLAGGLRDGDRMEALCLRMESRDGDFVVYLDRILRQGGKVGLGEHWTISGEESLWFAGPREG